MEQKEIIQQVMYRYIVAQIFGAFIAALLVYVQWHVNISVRISL